MPNNDLQPRRKFLAILGLSASAAIAGPSMAKADAPTLRSVLDSIDLERAAKILTAVRHKGCTWDVARTPEGHAPKERQLYGSGMTTGWTVTFHGSGASMPAPCGMPRADIPSTPAMWSLGEFEALAVACRYVSLILDEIG